MNVKSFLILRKCYKNEYVEFVNRDKNINYLLDKKYILPEITLSEDLSSPIWWSHTNRYSITEKGTDAYFDFRKDIVRISVSITGVIIALATLISQLR